MDSLPFGDDAPKREPEEDRLGYKEFSRRLALALAGIRAPNGYVVGVQAPWGAGKSTVLNFTKAFLAEARSDGLVVLDFAPWLISGHLDLVAGFFKVLAESLDFKAARRAASGRKAVKTTSSVVDPLLKAVGALIAALHPPTAPLATGASAVAGAAAKAALIDWSKEPSLQAAYEHLTSLLRKQRRRFVIFIDDLDRLEHSEIKAVAQLVKSVGSLPNVVYVLAYDRMIVRDALDGTCTLHAGQPSYDEKIIQHEVSLPTPTARSLMSLLDERTEALIGNAPNDERWWAICRNGTMRWIRTARDVVRLGNALAFAGPALADELDPRDLLAMEGLRLFEPAAFAWVKANQEFLVGEGYSQFLRDTETKATVARLHVSLPEPGRAHVIALLCTLFPRRAKEIAGGDRPMAAAQEPIPATVARRGIGTAAGFGAYLGLSGDVAEVSKRAVDAVFDDLDNPVVIRNALETYLKRTGSDGAPLIGPFLEELRFRLDAGATSSQALLNEVLRIGDAVLGLDRAESAFELHPRAYLTDMVDNTFEKAGEAAAAEMFLAAIDSGIPVSIVAIVYVERGQELGVFPRMGQSLRPMLDATGFEKVGAPVLARILTSVADGAAADAAQYWDIVRAWKHLGDPAAARTWHRQVAEGRAGDFAKIALGFLAMSISSRRRAYFVNSRPSHDADFSLEDLERLCRKHRDDVSLTVDGRARIVALQAGVERYLVEPDLKEIDGCDA